MNIIAEKYVKLVLDIGKYDPDFVDAYYGPPEWKPVEQNLTSDSAAHVMLSAEVDTLLSELESLASYKASELETLRYRYLYKQLLACKMKVEMLNGITFSFDTETKTLYDVTAPSFSDTHFEKIIDELDKILPGSGNVSERMELFKKNFVIPGENLERVFNAAINECRRRTLEHIYIPESENFKVEYVKNQPWGAYNWYKGNYFSTIQVNTDLPVYIDRAIDLAAHEGYPGHHVYNSLLEWNLANKRGWKEFTIYALFSPQSLIAEGTANYGIKMIFPGNERIKFEKEVLFPLAGLDSSEAEKYYKVIDLQDKLSYAGTEAARKYLDGRMNRLQTVEWLVRYALRTKESADKYVSFIEKYRSYVINYSLGNDLVEAWINSSGGTEQNEEKRWQLFEQLLSTPQTPGGLTKR
ncbi:MAG: hypothetical protein HXY49_04205 [Ignavibacteriaceae bacterium]|nr:hypothetical protein [Ignavibacteriaceae bacterium]